MSLTRRSLFKSLLALPLAFMVKPKLPELGCLVSGPIGGGACNTVTGVNTVVGGGQWSHAGSALCLDTCELCEMREQVINAKKVFGWSDSL